MEFEGEYKGDIQEILSRRHDLGGDYWTTPDNRLIKGGPFSEYDCAFMLLKLGVNPANPILKVVADLFFDTWKKDGHFKLYPTGRYLPCHTARAAYLLCHLSYQSDERIQKTYQYFLDTPSLDGG